MEFVGKPQRKTFCESSHIKDILIRIIFVNEKFFLYEWNEEPIKYKAI
jgi:hypothetical protein